jgi:hypothetical protein
VVDFQRLARPGDIVVHRLHEFGGGIQRFHIDARRRSGLGHDVELVLLDDERQPRRHVRDQHRKPAERHRLRVRLPVAFALRNVLQRLSRALGFAVQLCEEQIGQVHRILQNELCSNAARNDKACASVTFYVACCSCPSSRRLQS